MVREAFIEIITLLCRQCKQQKLVWVHLRDTAHLFGLGSPIGVRLGFGLGTVFLIRICETFFGLFSGSILRKKKEKIKKKKKRKMKEIRTIVNRIPWVYIIYRINIPFCFDTFLLEQKKEAAHTGTNSLFSLLVFNSYQIIFSSSFKFWGTKSLRYLKSKMNSLFSVLCHLGI